MNGKPNAIKWQHCSTFSCISKRSFSLCACFFYLQCYMPEMLNGGWWHLHNGSDETYHSGGNWNLTESGDGLLKRLITNARNCCLEAKLKGFFGDVFCRLSLLFHLDDSPSQSNSWYLRGLSFIQETSMFVFVHLYSHMKSRTFPFLLYRPHQK